MKISNDYYWLSELSDAPLMIQEAIKLGKLNTREIPGAKSNPEIIKLAEIAGVKKIYHNDDVAWCAVAQVAICILANKEVPFDGYDRLRAASFLQFGTPVPIPILGDVLVFKRSGGAHVGMYVGEDKECYHVVGGNQSNQFNVMRIQKNRLAGARRPKYRNQPKDCKRYFLSAAGAVSKNES